MYLLFKGGTRHGETHVTLIDDVGGTSATTTLGLDGISYEIDLSDENGLPLSLAGREFARRLSGWAVLSPAEDCIPHHLGQKSHGAGSAQVLAQPRRCEQRLHGPRQLVALVEDLQEIGRGELRALQSAAVTDRDHRSARLREMRADGVAGEVSRGHRTDR
ncbi:Lsr2 family protein [Micrococcales bacterium 31B]|nr:Lsr2 family protein [Micrococcales bacterium 31B]